MREGRWRRAMDGRKNNAGPRFEERNRGRKGTAGRSCPEAGSGRRLPGMPGRDGSRLPQGRLVHLERAAGGGGPAHSTHAVVAGGAEAAAERLVGQEAPGGIG